MLNPLYIPLNIITLSDGVKLSLFGLDGMAHPQLCDGENVSSCRGKFRGKKNEGEIPARYVLLATELSLRSAIYVGFLN